MVASFPGDRPSPLLRAHRNNGAPMDQVMGFPDQQVVWWLSSLMVLSGELE